MSSYSSYDPYDPYSSNDSCYDSAGSTYGSSMITYGDVPSKSSSKRQKEDHVSYFLPGHRISRQIIFSWYQRLLGPSATIRPFSYQQREGYMITNPGSPLTKEQIEDLIQLSVEYERKEAMRMLSRSGNINASDVFVNQPIPVQQRRNYIPETTYGYP